MLTVEGRETAALLALRNWVLVPMTTLCWISHLILAAQASPPISPVDLGCLLLASIAFCLALVFIRRPWVLWLSLTGLLLLVLPAFLPVDGGVWLYPRFVIGQSGYILITMLTRRLGLVVVAASPLLLRVLWALGPTDISPDGFTIAFGFVPVLQLLASNALIWWVWHGLVARSMATDQQLAQLQQAELTALADRERSALWWTSTRRVHESVLNSINALMSVGSVSQQAAQEWAARARAAVDVAEPGDSPAQPTPSRPDGGFFDGAQALVSAGFTGLVAAGTIYVFFIHQSAAWRDVLGRALMIAASVTALTLVLRRLRVAPLPATALILIPSAIPWVLAPAAGDCGQIATVASVLSISGYMIAIIALCGGLVPYLVAIPIWGAGAYVLASSAPLACQRSPIAMMFNTLSIIPLTLIVAYFGMRAHRASMVRLDDARARTALAIGRAEAVRLVNQQLSQSVERSAELLTEVGSTGRLTDEQERQFTCQSALLRAGISVDLERDGAFTLAAYWLVHEVASRGVPIRVVMLSGSQDRRSLPTALVGSLATVILANGDQLSAANLSISCVHGQSLDFLSVMMPWAIAEQWWGHHGRALAAEAEGDLCLAVHQTEQHGADGELLGLITIEREPAAQAQELVPVP
ncbi:MAG: hypothetical protein KGP12_10910 [Actinomycetales bacterium]|nr:hypothetical protein [Actinomycetales bacterium]